MPHAPSVPRPLRCLWIAAIAACAATSPAAWAQPPAPVVPATSSAPTTTAPFVALPPAELTPADVEVRLQQIHESALDADEKKRLADILQQAQQRLKDASGWAAKAADFDRRRNELPATLDAVRAELAAATQPIALEIPQGQSLSQLEQVLAQKSAALNEAIKLAESIEAEPRLRAERRLAIPTELAALKESLARIDEDLKVTAAPDAPPEAVAARQLSLQASRQAMLRHIDALNKELAFYEAAVELLPLRRDLAARRVERARAEFETWTEEVNRRRRMEAEAHAREALRDAAKVREFPALAELAEQNEQLAERRQQVASQIEGAAADLGRISKRLADAKERFERTRQRLDTAGTGVLGLRLRAFRGELPNLRRHRHSIAARQATMTELQLRQYEIAEERAELWDPRASALRLLSTTAATQPVTPAQLAAAERLVLARKEYLDALYKDYDTLLGRLVELNKVESDLVAQVDTISAYIDQHILWVRSTEFFGRAQAAAVLRGLRWLFDPGRWTLALAALWTDIATSPQIIAVAAAAILVLIVARPWLRRQLQATAAAVSSVATDSFSATASAMLIILLLASTFAAVPFFLGWRLTASPDPSRFAKTLGPTFQVVAVFWFFLDLLRWVSRKDSLGGAHFRWPAAVLTQFRLDVVLFAWLRVPLLFLETVAELSDSDEIKGSLGRLALILGALLTAVFVHRVMRPAGYLMTAIGQRAAAGLGYRMRRLWYALMLLTPLSLAVVAVFGYYDTALSISSRLHVTLMIVVIVLLLYAVVVRSVFAASRKIAYEAALKKRQAAQQPEPADAATPPEPGEPTLELTDIDAQTRAFLRLVCGLVIVITVGLIWVDLLPALNIFNRVVLWQNMREVTQEVKQPDGSVAVSTIEQLDPVTLVDLFLAAIVGLVVVAAARNLPGLLEITLLRRLQLASSSRYAVTALARYCISVVGMIAAFGVLGITWTDVQWLAAALTLGLGFGLQEVVANFVSGIILLFEQPIRVGDTVTVGGVSGTVTRIRIRATTIQDWDRKELVVPNKEFITGQVVNWTLSDPAIRLVVPIGVAYGSDTALTRGLLLRIAAALPLVLTDPKPSALFMGFGDSALNFELRVFVRNEDLLAVRHEINMEIDRLFKQHGIEIAFPQRDIHIRSITADVPPHPSLVNRPNP